MPDDEGLREELADVLAGREVGYAVVGYGSALAFANALLPVVERYAARRAAEALREAATAYYREPRVDVHDWLWDTADALAADGTEPHPAHRHDETGAGRG
jgi:hypothetical protein